MKNTARNLLEKMYGVEAAIWAEGDALHYKAPAGAIPPDVLESLKRNKQDVIQLLNTLPVFTPEQEKTLVDWYSTRTRDERLMIHRRGMAIRRDKQWPFYVADLQAIKETMDQSR